MDANVWLLAEVEKNHIVRVMNLLNGRTREVGATLGIETAVLDRKLEEHEIRLSPLGSWRSIAVKK